MATPFDPSGQQPSPFHNNPASASSATGPTPPKNKKICEVCGQADRRPTSSFLQNITTCEACKKFLERCQKQNKIKLRCKNGGRRGMTCNLATDRPCAKCRLDKAIQLVTRMKAQTASSASSSSMSIGAALSALSSSSSSAAISLSMPLTSHQSQAPMPGMEATPGQQSSSTTNSRTDSLNVYFQRCAETNTIETVKKLQLKVELLKYLKKSPHLAELEQQQGGNNNTSAAATSGPGTGPGHSAAVTTPVMPAQNVHQLPSTSSFISTASTHHQPSSSSAAPLGISLSMPPAFRCSPAQPYGHQTTASSSTHYKFDYGSGLLASPSPLSSSSSSLADFMAFDNHAPLLPAQPPLRWTPISSHQSCSGFNNQGGGGGNEQQQQQQPTTSSTAQVPASPVNHDAVKDEQVLQQIVRADQQLTAKKYRCDANFLIKRGIPSEETEFWKLVSWCIQDIALANLPFATQLASRLTGISHIDMCRLVENSYCLMFYAQTGLPNRLDVVSAFGMLFTRMRHAWTEIDLIMDHTREIVTAVREWKPSSTEFAFLLATVFCNGVVKERIIMPETMNELDHLTMTVSSAARAHMSQVYGEKVAQIRYQQLECIISSVKKLREGRRYALQCFFERNPKLAMQTVHPVVELVCRQYRDIWNHDYCSVLHTPTYPPPHNQEIRREVDDFTEIIMNSI